MEKMAQEVNGMLSSAHRASAGWEIKERVFDAVEHQKIADGPGLRKLVSLSLQSVTPDGEILERSGIAERINDASFLSHIFSYFKAHGGSENISLEYFLLMLRIGNTLDKKKRPYVDYDISKYCDWLLERSAFGDIVKVIKEINDNEARGYIVTGLENKLPYDLGYAAKKNRFITSYMFNYLKSGRCQNCRPYNPSYKPEEIFDKETTLYYAGEAEKLLGFLVTELETRKSDTPDRPKKGGKDTVPMWEVNMRRYVWQSYFVAGLPAEAKERLDSWIASINELKSRVQRVRALKTVADDVYRSDVDYQLALTLLAEAEKEANLLDDPRYREPELKQIERLKEFFK